MSEKQTNKQTNMERARKDWSTCQSKSVRRKREEERALCVGEREGGKRTGCVRMGKELLEDGERQLEKERGSGELESSIGRAVGVSRAK